MCKISPCLWFDGEAEEAATFYVSLLPDSRIDRVQKNPVDGPAGKAGSVLVVQFTLAGQEYMALNGGTRFEYTHAISFKIDCADQAEVDRLWTRCRPMAVRSNDAGGCGIAMASIGKSCPPRWRKYLAAPIARARSGRCKPCYRWSSSTSPGCGKPMRETRPLSLRSSRSAVQASWVRDAFRSCDAPFFKLICYFVLVP